MKLTLTAVVAATALGLAPAVALAAGNPAIANQTTTSMGSPAGSPGYQAPRSEVVPGVPAQARVAQEHTEMQRGTEHDANGDARQTSR
jgi:hypothetical protein